MYAHSSMPAVTLAKLGPSSSECRIVQLPSDSEEGDRLLLRCGGSVRSVGRALKGVEVDRLRSCAVMLKIAAVHVPKLVHVDACAGKPRIEEVGASWIDNMRRKLGIKASRIQYASFARRALGCYAVTLTYTARAKGDSPFLDRTTRFCIRHAR
jgi:hypothetical protein